jgi:ATP-dependent Clp protease ATP-binding subunit ClpC
LLALARYEALSRRQEFVGTHHMLLALARLTDRPVGRALAAAGAGEEEIQAALSEELEPGAVVVGDLPLTPTAQRALKSAGSEARARGSACATPEHLLSALLADAECIALATLVRIDVDFERLRKSLACGTLDS